MEEKGIVLTKDLTEIFNSTRLEGEKWKSSSVGWRLRGLGFIKIHTGQGNGWLIDEDRLRYLQQVYGIESPSPEKVQKVQKVHEDIDEMFSTQRILKKPSRKPTLRELEEDLRKSWRKGTTEEFIELIQQKSDLKEVEAKRRVAKLIALGKTVAEMQTRIEELEEMTKWQRDRLLELEQLVPPLEELMRFKKLLYSKKNKETK